MIKKTKLLGFLIIFGLIISSITNFKLTEAFSFVSVCQPILRAFSDGNLSFDISFPPGGGTTCDTFPPADSNCPTITLPANSTVYSIKMSFASLPGTEIETPYIWVPISAADYIAQIDTRDGFEAEIARYRVGDNPSRTFVIPGGDVWVANRGAVPDDGIVDNVTKLSPLTGDQPIGGTCGDGLCGVDENIYYCPADCSGNICGDGTGTCKNNIACGVGTEDCKEYKVVGHYPTGNGPRGVTGGMNGFIWVGNRNSGNVVKLDPNTGVIGGGVATGGGPYGLIADQFGYVWVSNRGAGTVQAIDVNTSAITITTPIGDGGPYGIGIDSNGDILVATCCGNSVYKINGYGTGVPGTIAWTSALVGGASTRGRGIASDLNGNVWVGSDNGAVGTVYSFTPSGAQYCPPYNPAPQHNTVGVAVDFNNNVWVVPYDGSVLKLRPDNVAACTAVVPVATVLVPGGQLYNYSDMTGLRTIPKSISFGGGSSSSLTEGAFVACTDGTGTCTDPVPCAAFTAYLAACVPDAMNNCEIPIEIFSIQSGDYVLSNLEVIYGKEVPITTGGLIPCGRDWDDLSTPLWDETDPCEFCHLMLLLNSVMNFIMKLAFLIALLAMIITGILFITSSGNQEKRSSAKNSLKWVLAGFIIILIAWLIVDFLLSVWGYLDPLGGQWNVVC